MQCKSQILVYFRGQGNQQRQTSQVKTFHKDFLKLIIIIVIIILAVLGLGCFCAGFSLVVASGGTL